MSSRLREVAAAGMGIGLAGIGDVYPVARAAPIYDRYRKHGSRFLGTIAGALANCTAGQNDAVLLSPESHSQAAQLVWDKNLTHLVGSYGPGRMNLRSRIGHSANFSGLIKVTGEGCVFSRIYTMYGRGDADNKICLHVNGNRNTFMNCHFGGPMHTTEAALADLNFVYFEEPTGGAGLEHYFKDCVIGVETIAVSGDGACMLRTKGTPRLVFEDCVFVWRGGHSGVKFLDGTVADGQGFVIFKNCMGLNVSATAMTVAFGHTGLAAGTRYYLSGSAFAGCTDLIAAAGEAQVIGMGIPAATTVTTIGLGIPYDEA